MLSAGFLFEKVSVTTIGFLIALGVIGLFVFSITISLWNRWSSFFKKYIDLTSSKIYDLFIKFLINKSNPPKFFIPKELSEIDPKLHSSLIEEYKNYEPDLKQYKPIDRVNWETPKLLTIKGNRVCFDDSKWISQRVEAPSKKITINISDINYLMRIKSNSLPSQISQLIASSKEYPVKKPVLNKITPPKPLIIPKKLEIPEPSYVLPNLQGSYAFFNSVIKKIYEADVTKVNLALLQRESLLNKQAKQIEELKTSHENAQKRYEAALSENEASFSNCLQEWEMLSTEWAKSFHEDMIQLREFISCFNDDEKILKRAERILNFIDLPHWMPNNYEIKFDKAEKILIVEHQFPDLGEIFWKKLVKSKFGESEKPANQKEIKFASEILYPSICLKLAYEISRYLDMDEFAIVVNGWADYTVKATGNKKRAYCASLMTNVGSLKNLNLENLDPLVAFNSLKGISARSLELTPISPQIKINLNDKRFVDEKEILGVMSDEQNLASMNWEDFEHLCRELFEREFASSGSVVKVTQASRDQGVDAVIIDPHPIRGGKIVIQAKRYVNTVDVSSVRDLYGTLMNEGAMKGILVSTSNFGQDAYAFIQGKPITLISGNELLGLLANHGYKYRINLEEARQFLKDASSLQPGNRYAGTTNFKTSGDF